MIGSVILTKETKVMLTRAVSRLNLSLKWVKTLRRNETFLLVIFSETAVSAENVNIDQQIYFLAKSYDIFEKYKINGHLVRRKLGRFLNNDYQGESNCNFDCFSKFPQFWDNLSSKA